MLVYDFKFGPDYAGQSATVSAVGGVEVAASPVTLDAAGSASLTLTEGNYQAEASNTDLALGNVITAGVANLAESIASGGSGVILDSDAIFFEINDGATLPIGGGAIPFDTLPDGYTLSEANTIGGLAVGLYQWQIECAFAQPAEDRLAAFKVNEDVGGFMDKTGPLYISADAGNADGYTGYASGIIRVGDGRSIFAQLKGATVAAPSSPADWTIDYFGLTLYRIG